MAKIIIRDKLKFRIFPKILWIDNEKIKLKSNSETIFETDEKYVILSENRAKNRRLGINLEDKKSRIEIRLIFLYNIFMTNITQNKLKYIFSNNNILLDSLKFCKKNNIGDSHLEYIKLSIDKFLACRDISKGFVKFKCPHCPVTHLFPVTCKSKLCP